MPLTDDQIGTWAKPPSETESEKCTNAISIASDALRARFGDAITFIRQGSHHNRTNIRIDSDIDLAVVHTGYSNYGYLLLGNIIEKVSGVSYYDYVAEHVFAPAGMTNTASLPEDQLVSGRAVAYTYEENGWVPAADTLPYRGTSAGGGYTTVGDLLKFAQALQGDKILPGRLVADATTPHNHAGNYGYGFVVAGQGLLQSYGHSGGAPGMNGDLIIYPQLKRVIIALSNFDPETAGKVANFYANRMPAMP